MPAQSTSYAESPLPAFSPDGGSAIGWQQLVRQRLRKQVWRVTSNECSTTMRDMRELICRSGARAARAAGLALTARENLAERQKRSVNLSGVRFLRMFAAVQPSIVISRTNSFSSPRSRSVDRRTPYPK